MDDEQVDTAPSVELTVRSPRRTVTVDVEPAAGGRIRQVTVTEGDDIVHLLAATATRDAWSSGWGSFPMAPWAGRVRHGRFRFLDHDVQLHLNHDDGTRSGGATLHPADVIDAGAPPRELGRRHSIHGTTFSRPWTVETVNDSTITMRCDLTAALGWPFAGHATQHVDLEEGGLRSTLTVEAHDRVFPASIGWHPWFAKPDRLRTHLLARYELDDQALPTGRLVEPGDGPWDDCFVNREPVELHYDRALAPVITVTSDCDHLVVYDRPDHATCVEPQSGPPDAPNVRPELVAPGIPLTRTMAWSW